MVASLCFETEHLQFDLIGLAGLDKFDGKSCVTGTDIHGTRLLRADVEVIAALGMYFRAPRGHIFLKSFGVFYRNHRVGQCGGQRHGRGFIFYHGHGSSTEVCRFFEAFFGRVAVSGTYRVCSDGEKLAAVIISHGRPSLGI